MSFTVRSGLLWFAVVCQIWTVWITWPLWNVRDAVPHLPLIDLPQFSFGWLMLLSAIVVIAFPTQGIVFHWIVLVAAAVSDQYRLQPQFFLIALLMSVCALPRLTVLTRWLIVSTWLWAGLHKFLSPDWMGFASHWLLQRTGLDADTWYIPFAISVATAELLAGLAACFRPRWAAILCVPIHLGIVLFLLLIDWNESVIPWNLCMAAVGSWVLWHANETPVSKTAQRLIAAVCLVYPLGFYLGCVDHGFAGVLYSDWLPSAQITTRNGIVPINGWGELAVPFPSEQRLFRQYFERSAAPGDKLHIADPRRMMDDQFLVLDDNRHAQPIDIDTFLLPQSHLPGQQAPLTPAVAGIGIDERRSTFELARRGVRMVKARSDQPIFAVEFPPDAFDPRWLSLLQGLPNLQQVQLAGTSVRDEDLHWLTRNRLLTGIGLENTNVTDKGVRDLKELPFLQSIEHDGTAITQTALDAVLKSPPQ
ncbi:hypothetical protein NHH03_20375 [Stieleria sp. TO1_6]|uniref:hypothetical protein n=1 Tax=Stieleria tagensis TaxID=2956795 RepID=UPI00209A9C02|nr:hypothetical protein [Stieleria tagensis]MCO8124112.1 hypothetical protein [Stieleria tagensis]